MKLFTTAITSLQNRRNFPFGEYVIAVDEDEINGSTTPF